MTTLRQKVEQSTLQIDKQIYDQIIGQEIQQVKPVWTSTAFMIHILLKVVPLGLYLTSSVLQVIFSNLVVNELLILFVVVDFWFTKNINGRKLIGLRWYLQEDQFGVQRLFYECRANEQFVSSISHKLFWGVQIMYVIFPTILIIITLVISPVLYQVNYGKVLLLVFILVGAAANAFFFIRATRGSYQKQAILLSKVNGQFLQKLGKASIISYF